MKVIKKNGNLETYDSEKIKKSIANTSDDIRQPLTKADLNTLCSSINDIIYENHKESIAYIEIRKIVEKVLRENGFSEVASHYINS